MPAGTGVSLGLISGLALMAMPVWISLGIAVSGEVGEG
jgi:hypothetical protein